MDQKHGGDRFRVGWSGKFPLWGAVWTAAVNLLRTPREAYRYVETMFVVSEVAPYGYGGLVGLLVLPSVVWDRNQRMEKESLK